MFFDIGWPELLVIAIVLVVVVGPKDLPRMLRTFGKTTTKLRSMAGDFRRQFDDALKEAELDDVKNLVSEARKLDPTAEIKKSLSPMQKAGEQIKSGLDAAMKPTPKADATPVAAVEPAPKPTAAEKTITPPAKPVARKTAAAKKPATRKAPAKAASKKSTGASS